MSERDEQIAALKRKFPGGADWNAVAEIVDHVAKEARKIMDAEIASLRAEVARLTEERDGFRNGQDQVQHIFDLLWSDVHGKDGLVAQMKIAAASLAASRALADRLAEAMELVLSWTPEDPHGELASDMAFARAALREWEEARRV